MRQVRISGSKVVVHYVAGRYCRSMGIMSTCEWPQAGRAEDLRQISGRADILASVLAREPDLTVLPAKINPRIPQLLRRALEKEAKQRWQAVGDMRVEIAAIMADGALVEAPQTAKPKPLWRRAIPVLVAAILASALTEGVTLWNSRPPAPLRVTRFPIALGGGQPFASVAVFVNATAISPDGTQMVYMENQRLYLRSMSELEARPIPGTDAQGLAVADPVFSPDGQSLVFLDFSLPETALKKIAVSGGAAVTIYHGDFPLGMSWGADGIVFGLGAKGIMRVSANGGKPETLVSLKAGEAAFAPQILPGGQAVLFTLTPGAAATPNWDKAEIVVQSLKSGERKTLIEGGSGARYLPTGHIVCALGGTLFAVPFDLRRLQLVGGPVPIVEGVMRGAASGIAQFNFSTTGSLIYIPGPALAGSAAQHSLALIDRTGSAKPLALPPGPYVYPRMSPGGKRIVFGTDDGKEAIVWMYDLSGTSSMRRLTFAVLGPRALRQIDIMPIPRHWPQLAGVQYLTPRS